MENIRFNRKQSLEAYKIIKLQADINYTHILCSDGRRLIVCLTMGRLQKRLSQSEFVRINRQEVVSIRIISHYHITGKSDYVWLKDGSKIGVSRRRRNQLRDIFNISNSEPGLISIPESHSAERRALASPYI